MNPMMLKNVPHAGVTLAEECEKLLGLDRDLNGFQGIAIAIHACEEVENEVPDR